MSMKRAAASLLRRRAHRTVVRFQHARGRAVHAREQTLGNTTRKEQRAVRFRVRSASVKVVNIAVGSSAALLSLFPDQRRRGAVKQRQRKFQTGRDEPRRFRSQQKTRHSGITDQPCQAQREAQARRMRPEMLQREPQ
jgi:hypothetical protein